VAVEVDADARPVEARRDLLDMRRFPRAVIALHHHALVVREAGEDGERGFFVEAVNIVDLGHVILFRGEGGHLQVGVDAERLAHGDHDIGDAFVGNGGGNGHVIRPAW
jgi:hypothetical protein